MGDFIQTLFGGSQSSSASTPKDKTPAEIKGLRGPFADALKGLIGGPGPLGGIPSFTGTTGEPMVAPITGDETNVLQNILGQMGSRTPLLNQTMSGNFLPGQPGQNPAMEATISAAQRPTFQALAETLERTLPGRFTQGGQITTPGGSSAFDRAAAIASRGAADAASDIATNIAFGTYEAERGRQQQAIQLSQDEVDTTVKILQSQGLPRLIQDLGLERGQEEFKNRTDALLRALAVITGAPLTTIANAQQSQSTSSEGIFKSMNLIPGAVFPRGL